jgi:adenosylhomocysteine nucleosidase
MRRLILSLALITASALAQRPNTPPYDPTPRIGVLIPKGPPDYALWYDALHDHRDLTDGAFTYQTGTISGVPVVLTVQPTDGEVMRALDAITMIHTFNVRALLYPGTSGGHLPKGQMSVGDIVLGAKNVNHGDYYLSRTGEIQAGEFNAINTGLPPNHPIYADPQLLAMLACSAHRIATTTTLPTWLEPIAPNAHPQIFYFGIQGSSTIWSDNKAYTEATMKVFHEIDEDGDWYSNLAATLYNVPFIEVSVISNSIYAFPDRSHGTPTSPANEPNSHVLAQRLSNRIALDLIAHNGQRILTGTFTDPTSSPYPSEAFDHPTNPGTLLSNCP